MAAQLGLNSFSSALTLADYGITKILEGRGPFTVFAPSDAAFSALPVTTLNALRNNPLDLRKVLLYHVVPGFFPSSSLTNGTPTYLFQPNKHMPSPRDWCSKHNPAYAYYAYYM